MKTKKQVDAEWRQLYEYVRTDILEYGTKSLSKELVLRLKGLQSGNYMANNKINAKGKYDFCDILLCFKLNKIKIQNAIKSKEFKDERHKMNYMMAIVENDINNVVDMIQRKKKSDEMGKEVNTTIEQVEDKADYKKRTETKKSKILNNLW